MSTGTFELVQLIELLGQLMNVPDDSGAKAIAGATELLSKENTDDE
jgi:hypothetical protein